MAIREFLNKYPSQTKAGTIIVIIVALSISIWYNRSGGPSNASKAYYSTDDGATTFVDDFFKAYPFDHDGKPAYRAYVFQGSDGKQFVGYLERYTPAGLSDLQSLLSKGGNREQLRDQIQSVRSRGTELKAPKNPDAKWYPVGSGQAEGVTSAATSNLGANASVMMVFP
jgi:hypothetical protein